MLLRVLRALSQFGRDEVSNAKGSMRMWCLSPVPSASSCSWELLFLEVNQPTASPGPVALPSLPAQAGL